MAKSVHRSMGSDPPDADDTKAGKACTSPHEMLGMHKMGKGAGKMTASKSGNMMSSSEK